MTTVPFPAPLSSPIHPSGSENPWQAAADEALADRFRVWLHEKGVTSDRLAGAPEIYENTFRDIGFEFLRRVFLREIESLDDGVPEIERDGEQVRRVAPTPRTLMILFGPVTVSRPRYCPVVVASVTPIDESLDLKAGCLTPAAARVTLHALSPITHRDCQALFRALGPGLDPSVSTIAQRAHDAGDRWETVGDTALAAVRETETVPEAATTVAVLLDGVQVYTLADDQSPAGWREAACAVVELHDSKGKRLRTVRCGHMPETKKAELKRALAAELDHVRRAVSTALIVVAIANGALENRAWLSELDPDVEILDLFHAIQHIKTVAEDVFGPDTEAGTVWFEKYHAILHDDPKGVDRLIRAIRHLRSRGGADTAWELEYFRKNRARMPYADFRARNLPVGSGSVESTNKLLMTQRLKKCGQRWSRRGGQAILSFRALEQSGRFDPAWRQLQASWTRSSSASSPHVANDDRTARAA